MMDRGRRSRRRACRIASLGVLLSLAAMAPAPLAAQTAQPPEAARAATPETVTLDLAEVSLRQALARLFAMAKVGYTVAPDVPNVALTLRLKELPFEEALQVITRFAGAGYRKEGERYVITLPVAAPPVVPKPPTIAVAPLPPALVTAELRQVPFPQAVEEVCRSVGARYALAPGVPATAVSVSLQGVDFATTLTILGRLAHATYRVEGGLYVLGPGPGLPPPLGPALREEPVAKRVTAQLKEVPLADALAELFRGTGREYQIAAGLQDVPVTASLRAVEFTRALRQVLGGVGLTYHREGARRYVVSRRPGP